MPTFIQKPKTVEAVQYDGENFLPGMSQDGGRPFIKDNFDNEITVYPGNWIVTDRWGIRKVYSDPSFKQHFAPAE